MSEHYHALVWIDHHEAKIFRFDATTADQARIRSSHPHEHLHHKANSRASGHASVDEKFLERVAHALVGPGAILITGPSTAKKELAAYLVRAHPDVARKVSGVETLDHPSDGELVAFARSFFKADDRMHSQAQP